MAALGAPAIPDSDTAAEVRDFDAFRLRIGVAAFPPGDPELIHHLIASLTDLMSSRADPSGSALTLMRLACAITPGQRIAVRFYREPGAVVVAVWDGSDEMPCVRPVKEPEFDDLDLSEASR